MMEIQVQIAQIDEILDAWAPQLGADLAAYRNHVYRMAHFCFALTDGAEADRRKIAIAAAFHDLGIWSDRTVDYLPPSVARARSFLVDAQLEPWTEEIESMIDLHHKLRAVGDPRFPLVESFRKADLVDVSLGMVRFGISSRDIQRVKGAFPNSGFHKRLGQIAGQWFSRHPFSPPPFLKW